MPKKISLYDCLLEREYMLPVRERIVVGRDRSKSDLVIPCVKGTNDLLEFVSGGHCELCRHDIGYELVLDLDKTQPYFALGVRDLKSKNGTTADGRIVSSDKETFLRDKSMLMLGPYILEVRVEEES